MAGRPRAPRRRAAAVTAGGGALIAALAGIGVSGGGRLGARRQGVGVWAQVAAAVARGRPEHRGKRRARGSQ